MTNLQKLETAIRKALPELMELEPFTKPELELKLRHGINVSQSYKHEIDILHLLRWLDTLGKDYRLSTNGGLFRFYFGSEAINGKWICFAKLDLSKPLLSQQSQDVIDELVKFVK